MSELLWRALAAQRFERCTVTPRADGGTRIAGEITGEGACRYDLTADSAWRFVSLDLTAEEGTLAVRLDRGAWAVDGAARADLAAAREIDLSVSPVTNTLPIRRLALGIGESADIVTAYVDRDEMTVRADPQRYTRLAEREYLYESRDSDFRRTITVDDEGFVLDYPGLFSRAT